jgi:hypothetical protein
MWARTLFVIAAACVDQNSETVLSDQETLDGDDQDSARRILKARHKPGAVLVECACVQSPKISNGDKIGPSNSTIRRSVDAPKVQCD